jgi:glutamate synthase (NADPH/NADH) small chain
MPARGEEVEHAMEEGIIFDFLRNPTQILGDDQGKVTGLELLKYELGEPDASGRRSPVAIKGSEFVFDCDTVIVALGNESNPLISKTTAALQVDKKGRITVEGESQRTSLDRVYAGGDIVLGAATVILAMGEGRRAAAAINKLLSN